MTAEQIRARLDYGSEKWDGFEMYTESHGAIPALLVEIAAQLAELNQKIRPNNGQGG